MNTQYLRFIALLVLLLSPIGTPTAGEPLRVDFNPNDDRTDVRSRHAFNWRIVPGASVVQAFPAVTVTIRPADTGQGGVTWGWWKGGFDTGATFVSDGVTRDA